MTLANESCVIHVIPIEEDSTSEAGSSEVNVETQSISQENEQSNRSKEYFKEFLSESTVHGFRYFTDNDRHFAERVWWLISLVLSIVICVYAILNVWGQWQDRPVIVSFDDKTTPIQSIPFPAITICTSAKFSNSMTFGGDKIIHTTQLHEMLTKSHKGQEFNLSSDEINQADVYQQMCLKRLMYLDFLSKHSRTESIYKTIKLMAPEIHYVIMQSNIHRHQTYLNPIFTNEGLCFTFNSLNSKEIYTDEIHPELKTVRDNPNAKQWNRDDGYQSDDNKNELFPYRVSSTSEPFSVILLIDEDADYYDHCSRYMHGFRLALHTPDELPRMNDNFVLVPNNKEFYIFIRPNMIVTSNGLADYEPEKRGCFYRSEHPLRFFRFYTQKNCELECLANFTKQACGCVQYSLPGDNQTEMCSIYEHSCYMEAYVKFSENLLATKNCNCLPDCTSITYDFETSQTEHRQKKKTDSTLSRSYVTVSFKKPHFIALLRTETNTMTDFMASCGGLLGLFMGISILSLVEFIYYFTLRLFCIVRQRNIIENTA